MTEPKTNLEVGVWFDQKTQNVWQYRGTLPVLIQFNKKTPEHWGEPYCVSRCPPCELAKLKAQFLADAKRWMIVPP